MLSVPSKLNGSTELNTALLLKSALYLILLPPPAVARTNQSLDCAQSCQIKNPISALDEKSGSPQTKSSSITVMGESVADVSAIVNGDIGVAASG